MAISEHISRIQNYLHFKARSQREVVVIGPFTLYLQTGVQLDESVAIPAERDVQCDAEALKAIELFFCRRAQTPRFQFLDAYAPQLGAQLHAAGYTCREQLPVLFCRPGQTQMPDSAPLLEFVVSSAHSPLAEVAEGWNINARGFDPAAVAGTAQEIESFRQSLVTARAFTARWNGEGVAAGMFIDIENGVTELVGITTLEPYRRHGIASALTAYMTAVAFEQGATLTFLSAASPAASRVYQWVGYQHVANLVTWVHEQGMGCR